VSALPPSQQPAKLWVLPDKPEDGSLEAAAFAGAGRDRGTWICVLSKRRLAWLTSNGATPLTRATGRSEFHLAQPTAGCVSSQNSGGRNSVRSENSLGRRTRPVPHHRNSRSLKKCLLKNFKFPPTHEPISRKPPRSDQFHQREKRSFTGDSRDTRVHREATWTHTNASHTHKSPLPTAIHPV